MPYELETSLLLQSAEIPLCLIIPHYKHLEISRRQTVTLCFLMAKTPGSGSTAILRQAANRRDLSWSEDHDPAMVRRWWTGLLLPRNFGGDDSRLPLLSPWHGETPQVILSQCLCLRYFPASLVTWVILRSSFQAEVLTNWWRRLWHLRRRKRKSRREGKVYGGGGEMKRAFENHKVSIENGGIFSLLRTEWDASTVSCWF